MEILTSDSESGTSKTKGAPAIECRTSTWLVSPGHSPEKKKLEASTTKCLNCHRTPYWLMVTHWTSTYAIWCHGAKILAVLITSLLYSVSNHSHVSYCQTNHENLFLNRFSVWKWSLQHNFRQAVEHQLIKMLTCHVDRKVWQQHWFLMSMDAICPEARDPMGTWPHTLFTFTYFDN